MGKISKLLKTINPYKDLKPEVRFGLYSKAEETAYKMPQAKQLGSDAKRYFLKQGVTKDEMDALGLTELFKQNRVTQKEIVDTIQENRILLREKEDIEIDSEQFDGSFGVDEREQSIEEVFGDDYIYYRGQDFLEDPLSIDADLRDEIDDYINNFYELDPATEAKMREDFELFMAGEKEYDDLRFDMRQRLEDRAQAVAKAEFDEESYPAIRLSINGEYLPDEFEIYSNPDGEFYTGANAPEALRVAFGDLPRPGTEDRYNPPPRDLNEAMVRVRSYLYDYEPERVGQGSETRWRDYTLEGGENYREYRFQLDKDEQFREKVHFPEDVNNIFHIRTTDRFTPDGKKILFVEELQSDWAQRGRMGGFKDQKKIDELSNQLSFVRDSLNQLDLDPEKLMDSGSQIGRQLHEALWLSGATGSDVHPSFRDLAAKAVIKAAREIEDLTYFRYNKFSDEYVDSLKPRDLGELFLHYYQNGPDAEIAQHIKTLEDAGLGNKNVNKILNDVTEKALSRGEVISDTEDQILTAAKALSSVINSVKSKTDNAIRDQGEFNQRQLQAQAERSPAFNKMMLAVNAEKSQMRANADRQLAEMGITPEAETQLQLLSLRAQPALEQIEGVKGLPEPGPFVTDTDMWTKLGIKRLANKATAEGYDGIGFSSGKVEYDRWGDQGLVDFYDKKVPSIAKNVTGQSLDKKMEIDGYEVPYMLFTEKGRKKVSDPQTMFQIAGAASVPGIVALGALSPKEAKAEEQRAANFSMDYPKVEKPGIGALSGQLALGAGTEIAGAIGGGMAGMLEYLRGAYSPRPATAESIKMAREGIGGLIGGVYDAGPEAQELGQEIMQDIGQTVAPFIDYALEGPIMDEQGLNLVPLIAQKLGIPAYQVLEYMYNQLPRREQEAVISAGDALL